MLSNTPISQDYDLMYVLVLHGIMSSDFLHFSICVKHNLGIEAGLIYWRHICYGHSSIRTCAARLIEREHVLPLTLSIIVWVSNIIACSTV